MIVFVTCHFWDTGKDVGSHPETPNSRQTPAPRPNRNITLFVGLDY